MALLLATVVLFNVRVLPSLSMPPAMPVKPLIPAAVLPVILPSFMVTVEVLMTATPPPKLSAAPEDIVLFVMLQRFKVKFPPSIIRKPPPLSPPPMLPFIVTFVIVTLNAPKEKNAAPTPPCLFPLAVLPMLLLIFVSVMLTVVATELEPAIRMPAPKLPPFALLPLPVLLLNELFVIVSVPPPSSPKPAA